MPTHPVAEAGYPITFRESDAKTLGAFLRRRQSVELIGMKRVGISNFLRFFLYHTDIASTYISPKQKHLFIPVDLNDLVERELQPFWILTLKRLVDSCDTSDLDQATKDKVSAYFLQSIQLQDNFLTIENIRKTLDTLIVHGYTPTIFFLRFDRIGLVANPELVNNLESLIESTNGRLAFVFTSVRPLDQIKPEVFSREELTTFSTIMYIKPANHDDSKIMLNTVQEKFEAPYPQDLLEMIVKLSGGHMQYLYLALTILSEKTNHENSSVDEHTLHNWLVQDERIKLQSEEILESLTKLEQDTLKKVALGEKVRFGSDTDYLSDTGIVQQEKLFSDLLQTFLEEQVPTKNDEVEFSKKELKLFTLLQDNIGAICERDDIISAVWPEYEEAGVSDWTIDRLVARLRQKLSLRKSEYAIVTVKTRGYKLVQA